jgi:hypothetical protein
MILSIHLIQRNSISWLEFENLNPAHHSLHPCSSALMDYDSFYSFDSKELNFLAIQDAEKADGRKELKCQ